jgi:hypothetical protein
MTLHTASGSLPHHVYALVERRFTRRDAPPGFEPCVWFGLRSYPGRAWGCHVMLECGAVVRDLPLHALATREDAAPWTITQAQAWDCYGWQFGLHAYTYLSGLDAEAKCADAIELGSYLFSAIPIGDGWTAEPGESKEFCFLALHNGRFAAQPTNRVLFEERSFTDATGWPQDVLRQTEVWSCETDDTTLPPAAP